MEAGRWHREASCSYLSPLTYLLCVSDSKDSHLSPKFRWRNNENAKVVERERQKTNNACKMILGKLEIRIGKIFLDKMCDIVSLEPFLVSILQIPHLNFDVKVVPNLCENPTTFFISNKSIKISIDILSGK